MICGFMLKLEEEEVDRTLKLEQDELDSFEDDRIAWVGEAGFRIRDQCSGDNGKWNPGATQ